MNIEKVDLSTISELHYQYRIVCYINFAIPELIHDLLILNFPKRILSKSVFDIGFPQISFPQKSLRSVIYVYPVMETPLLLCCYCYFVS